MCFVIVTCRSMLWTLLTIAATLLVVGSVITPQWLVGEVRWVGLRPSKINGTIRDYEGTERTYRPTIGVFNRCTKQHLSGNVQTDSCTTYVTGFDMPSSEFPDLWKSSLIFIIVAGILLGFTNFTAVFSLCIQALFKKSIFTVSGLIQSIAGLFLIIGMVLYAAGLGAENVQSLCGDATGPFQVDGCSIGWAFYGCMGGTVLVFACAMLSIQAETSTSSDKVEREVIDGKNLICIL